MVAVITCIDQKLPYMDYIVLGNYYSKYVVSTGEGVDQRVLKIFAYLVLLSTFQTPLGYVFMINSGAVLWSSKKQELVTLSTAEAEYVAATHAAKEVLWLHSLIGEIFSLLELSTTFFGDNKFKSAIALANGGQYHSRTKHINICYHFIHYIIEAKSIKLIYCPTDKQTADTLTKALPSAKAKHFVTEMGLCVV